MPRDLRKLLALRVKKTKDVIEEVGKPSITPLAKPKEPRLTQKV